MSFVTLSEEVFACYSKLCAPPPVGKGGSSRGGRAGARAWARRTGISMAQKRRNSLSTAARYDTTPGRKTKEKEGTSQSALDLTKKFGGRGAAAKALPTKAGTAARRK